jgi:hypothetical protein
MALLLCQLVQGTVLPTPVQMPPPMSMSMHSGSEPCAHHTLMQHHCCKSTTCPCLQVPALMPTWPPVPGFVAAAEVTSVLILRSPPVPAGKFFRPPI